MLNLIFLTSSIVLIFLALIAGLLIPNKKKILARQTTIYKKWKQVFVYIVGTLVIIGGAFVFIFWISSEKVQSIPVIINFSLLIGTGIVLVEENYRKSMSLQRMKEIVETPAGVSEIFPVLCRKCGNIINVTSSLKDEVIVCPYCGMPGKMGGLNVRIKPAMTPEKTISIKCGGCGSEIKISPSLAGKIIKCPYCGVKGRIR